MSKLILPHEMYVQRHRARERVVTLADGRRARIQLDDSSTVQHTETDETMDALVRPQTATIRVKIDPERAAASPWIQRLLREERRGRQGRS